MDPTTPPPEAAIPYPQRRQALLVLCLSLVVIGMDNTILNVALPTLAQDLQATGSQLQWIVDSYVLVFAGLLLSMGALGDRFGRKRALNVGLMVFVVASIASAYATTPTGLILSRGVMGVGGALIMPSTLSIITNIFPPDERGRAIATWAGVAGFGILLGPVVGGWLLESFWWGAVFLVNVPIVALALTAGWRLIPESRDPVATPLDPVGATLSVAALSTLVYAIIEAPNHGWGDGLTVALFTAAALLFSAFIWWERRTPHPMLRMEFFRNLRFTVASAAIMLVFFSLFGALFLLTQHLQFVLGYGPLEAGYRLLPLGTLIVAAPLSARLDEAFGTRVVVAAGMTTVAVGMALLSTAGATTGYGVVAATLAVLGVGMGLTMAPATDSIMGSLPLAKAGVGSAMNDTTRMVGGALGVAVLGSVLSSSYQSAIAPALAAAPPEVAGPAGESIGAASVVAARVGGMGGQQLLDTARSAFVDGMGDAILVAAGAAALGAVLVVSTLPARARPVVPVPDTVSTPVT